MLAVVCCKPTYTSMHTYLLYIRHFSVNVQTVRGQGSHLITSFNGNWPLYLPSICEPFDAIFVISISLPYTYSISPKSITSGDCYLSHWTPWFIEFLTKTEFTEREEEGKSLSKLLGFEMLFVAFTVGWTICFLCVWFYFSSDPLFVIHTQLNATFYSQNVRI